MYCCYTLVDTRDFDVFYVGKTRLDLLNIRKNQHKYETKRRNDKRSNKIKKLLKKGYSFEIIPTKFYKTEEEAYKDEENIINYYRNRGYNLCNTTPGGEGVRNPSLETRKKLSKNASERFSGDGNPSKRPEVKAKRAKFFKENNPMYNEKIKTKTIKAIMKSCAKKVCQYSLEGEYINTFDSIKDASRKTGKCRYGISGCCNKKLKTSGGFIWKFDSNINDLGDKTSGIHRS